MIGGTSFSGSTMFNLMLANIDGGLACGEVYALYRPRRKHHQFPTCGCNDENCTKWYTVRERGERDAYNAMFDIFLPTSTIVDSSKNLLWYNDQQKYLKNSPSVEVHNVLLWKTPIEFAYSIWKRGKYSELKDLWRVYHSQYLALTNGNFSAIKYRDLVNDPEQVLHKLCKKMGLPYVSGMSQYWNREQHILFGSETARLHLHSQDTNSFEKMKKNLTSNRPNVIDEKLTEVKQHQSVYYDDGYKQKLPKQICSEVERDDTSTRIEEILTLSDIQHVTLDNKDLLQKIKKVKAKPGWHLLNRGGLFLGTQRRKWFDTDLE